MTIPEQMRALELGAQHEEPGQAIRNLRVAVKAVPRPAKGQVLVRMEAAPCNPSDLLFLQGLYRIKRTLPTVPGFEGSGTVVASGGGLLGRALMGKRVACGGQRDADGTWAEYFVAESQLCIPLNAKVSFEQGAALIINPMTALALFDMARRGKHRAAVLNAAASQLGRMLIRVAARANYPLLCVVRRADEAAGLQSAGAVQVLSSEHPDFAKALHAECNRLGATIAFDAIGGSATGQLIDSMPPHSVVVVYGALAEAACEAIDPGRLIFEDKRIENFWLTTWLQRTPLLQRVRTSKRVQRLIASGDIDTTIRRRVKLDEVAQALSEYRAQMGRGKMLITPSMR